MTSRRAEANRQNAQKSTGPRSIAGKTKASRNAIRHGLNTAVAEASPAVGDLARQLAGEFSAIEPVFTLAIRAAQAIINYRQVGDTISHVYLRLEMPPAMVPVVVKYAPLPSCDLEILLHKEIEDLFAAYAKHEEVVPITVPAFAKTLDNLARYERRAYSARTSAIKAFDAAVVRHLRRGPHHESQVEPSDIRDTPFC